MYYRSRYYQPEIGRFLNQDYYQGDKLVPPSLHRYTYTHNNPIRYIDPTGEYANAVMAAAGLVLMLAAGAMLIWAIESIIENDQELALLFLFVALGVLVAGFVIFAYGTGLWPEAELVQVGYFSVKTIQNEIFLLLCAASIYIIFRTRYEEENKLKIIAALLIIGCLIGGRPYS